MVYSSSSVVKMYVCTLLSAERLVAGPLSGALEKEARSEVVGSRRGTFLERVREAETEVEAEQDEEVQREIKDEVLRLQDRLNDLLAANEEAPALEKLDREEFVIDEEGRDWIASEIERRVEQVKQRIQQVRHPLFVVAAGETLTHNRDVATYERREIKSVRPRQSQSERCVGMSWRFRTALYGPLGLERQFTICQSGNGKTSRLPDFVPDFVRKFWSSLNALPLPRGCLASRYSSSLP